MHTCLPQRVPTWECSSASVYTYIPWEKLQIINLLFYGRESFALYQSGDRIEKVLYADAVQVLNFISLVTVNAAISQKIVAV